MQEGGRVLNLGDNTNKVKSMNQVLKIYKKIENKINDLNNGFFTNRENQLLSMSFLEKPTGK